MPIRQPYSGFSPSASACSSSVAPEFSRLLAGAVEHGPALGALDGLQRGGLEVLDPQPRVVGERLLDQLDEAGRAAGPGVDVGVPREDPGQLVGAVERAGPGLGVDEVDVHVRGQVGELVGVDLVVGRLGVVQERDACRRTRGAAGCAASTSPG